MRRPFGSIGWCLVRVSASVRRSGPSRVYSQGRPRSLAKSTFFLARAMLAIQRANERDERVLILAPSRRDGPTVAAILERAGLGAETFMRLADLCSALDDGAGAALVVEEAVST